MKEAPAPAIRSVVDEIGIGLDRWAALYETTQSTETVGNLAGYIL